MKWKWWQKNTPVKVKKSHQEVKVNIYNDLAKDAPNIAMSMIRLGIDHKDKKEFQRALEISLTLMYIPDESITEKELITLIKECTANFLNMETKI